MSDHAQIAIRRTESGYLFSIAGRGTMRESPAVRDFVCGAIEDGADVVLELSDCEYLDSTFLGCLVMMHQRGKQAAGSFAVLADDVVRTRLLGQCHLDRLLAFVDARPSCHGEPVALTVPHLDRSEFGEHLMETHRLLADLGGPSAETFRQIAEQLAAELRGRSGG